MDTKILRKISYTVIGIMSLLLTASLSYGQTEICNDGIDNDGDGFVDCYDMDCMGSIACEDFFMQDNADCQVKPTEFPKFNIREVTKSPSQTASNRSVIVVGDILGDKTPEVIVANAGSWTTPAPDREKIYVDKLYILNGKDLKIINSTSPGFGGEDWQEYLAVAKIDNANCGYIFLSTGTKIIAYDCNLNVIWETGKNSVPEVHSGSGRYETGPLHLADFRQDGSVQLYYKNEIRNALTGAVLLNGSGNWINEVAAGSIAVDISKHTDHQGLELINGLSIYNVKTTGTTWSLELIKKNDEYFPFTSFGNQNHNFTSIADYDLNGELDIIANGAINSTNGAPTVFLWQNPLSATAQLKKFSFDSTNPTNIKYRGNPNYINSNNNLEPYGDGPAYRGTGIVNIANIDNQPGLNCTFAVRTHVYALDGNFNFKWRTAITENSSGNTGTTVFDFNGDGSSEIVYRDENYLYIIQDEGGAGVVKTKFLCGSQTGREYPIVVDVNGDGETEILASCAYSDNFTIGSTPPSQHVGTVKMFASLDEKWVRARTTWNQHGYFNVNINDDLTVPIQQQNHILEFPGNCNSDGTGGKTRPLNTFLNQSPYLNAKGCPSYASPDLSFDDESITINRPVCPETDFTMSFKLINKGDLAITNKKLYVSFYNGVPLENRFNLLNMDSVLIPSLSSGDSLLIENLRVKGTGGNFTLYARFNDPATISECDSTNNTFYRNIIPRPFNIAATKLIDNLQCTPDVDPNGEAKAYVLPGDINNTAGYTFTWFKKVGSDFEAVSPAPGAYYTKMAEGDYKVTAIHTLKGCGSDTASITIIPLVDNYDELVITQEHAYTSCKTPNGALKANMYINGVLQDPDNYTYIWVKSNWGNNDTIGINATATQLLDRTYRADVTNKKTGCLSILGETVESLIDIPILTNFTITDINKCDATPDDGKIVVSAATVNGNPINVQTALKYRWFTNAAIDTTGQLIPGETTYTLANRTAGVYGVVGILESNGCPSQLFKPEIVLDSKDPNLTFQFIPNTSCDPTRPNGKIRVTVGPSTANLSKAYIKKWNYTTNNWGSTSEFTTYAELANANLDSGMYHFYAFHNASTCMERTFNIGYELRKLDKNLVNFSSVAQTNCVSASSTDPLPNGRLSANFNNLTTGYDFNWYKGTGVKLNPDYTGHTVNNVATMDYTLKVIETATLCEADAVYPNVGYLPDLPIINAIPTPNTSCDDSQPNGAIVATATTNIAPPATGYRFRLDAATEVTTNSFLAENLFGSQTYNLRVTNPSSHCYSTQNVLVSKSSEDIPVINAAAIDSVANTICVGTGNGSIDATNAVDGDPAGYTFHWYGLDGILIPGQTGPILSNLRDGLYQLGVTKTSSSCPSSGNVYIRVGRNYQYPIPTLDVTQQQTICDGAPNGALRSTAAMPIGIVEPPLGYGFTWYRDGVTLSPVVNNPSESTLTGQPVGSFKVLVTNNNTGCARESDPKSITPNLVRPPVVTVNATDNTLCFTNTFNGTLTVEPSEVSAANRYMWYNSSDTHIGTGTSIGSLKKDSYKMLVVVIATGCESDPIYKPIDNAPDYPSIDTLTAPNTNCAPMAPNGFIRATATSIIAPPATGYVWQLNALPTVITNTFENNGLAAITHTVRATNPNTECSSSIQVPVKNAFDIPVINLALIDSLPNTICVGTGDGSINASNAVTGDPSGYTFHWYGLDGNLIPGQSGPILSSLRDGTYRLGVTRTVSGCPADATVPIRVGRNYTMPNVELAVTHEQTSCDATNPNGELTGTAYMTGVPNPTNGFKFEWSDPGNTTETITVAEPDNKYYSVLGNQPKGSYRVRVTNENTGCFTLSGNEFLDDNKVNPIVTATSSANTHCEAPFSGSLTIDAPVATHTYTWYHPNGSLLSTGTSIDELNGGNAPTPMVYKLVVEDQLTSCESELTFGVLNAIVLPTVSIDIINQQTHCSTDPDKHNGELEAMPTPVGTYIYTWRIGASNGTEVTTIADGGKRAIQLTNATYYVTVKQDVTGCTATASRTVNHARVRPVVSATATEITRCDPFDGKVSADVNLQTAGYSFEWSNPDWTANVFGSTIIELAPDTYTVYATEISTECRSVLPATAIVEDNVTNQVVVDFDTYLPYIPYGGNDEIIFPSHCKVNDGQIKFGIQDLLDASSEFDVTWYHSTELGIVYVQKQDKVVESNRSALLYGDYLFDIFNRSNGCVTKAQFHLPWIGSSTLNIDNVINTKYCREPFDGAIEFSMTTNSNYNIEQDQFIYLLYEGVYHVGSDPDPFDPDNPRKPIIINPSAIPGFDPDVHLTYTGLAPGLYTLAVIETWSTAGCEEEPMSDQVLIETIYPEMNPASMLSLDYSCAGGTATGVLAATAYTPDPDPKYDAQGYEFKWYDYDVMTGDTIRVGSQAPVPGVTSITINNLVGDVYYQIVGTNQETRCDASAILELPKWEREMAFPTSQVAITPQDRCFEENGTVWIKEITEDGNNIRDDYSLTLLKISDATFTVAGTLAAAIEDLGAANDYYIVAENPDTKCTGELPVIIDLEIFDPVIVATATDNNYCDYSIGVDGKISAVVDETLIGGSPTEAAGYAYEWYSTSDLTTVISTASSIEDLPAGDYKVIITDNDGKYRTCFSEKIIEIEDNVPVIAITDIAVIDQTWCGIGNDNGQVTVVEIKKNGVTQDLADYLIEMTDPESLVGHTFTRNAGEYKFMATHIVFGCPSTIASATIEPKQPTYYMEVTVDEEDYSCNPNGKGELTARVMNNNMDATGNFTFDWFYDNLSGSTVTTPVTISGNSSTASQLKGNRDYAAYALNTDNHCEADIIEYLPWTENQIVVVESEVDIIDQDDCTNGNGEILVREVRENNIPGIDYTLYLYDPLDMLTPLQDLLFGSGPFTALGTGNYIITARNNDTDCISPEFMHTVGVDTLNPHIVSTYIFNDQYCSPIDIGNGAVHVAINEAMQGNGLETSGYSYEWFLPSDISTPIANSHELVDKPSGHYLVKVRDIDGKYNNCEAEQTFFIDENNPIIAISKISTIDQTNCVGDNGIISVEQVTINGVPQTIAGNYYIQLLPNAAGTDTTFVRNTGTYQFKAIHRTFGCESGETDGTIDFTKPTYQIDFASIADYSCRDDAGLGSISSSVLQNNVVDNDFDFSWWKESPSTFTSNLQNITDLLYGQYYLKVTDMSSIGLGCEYEAPYFLHRIPKTVQITGNDKIDQTYCFPNGAAWITNVQEFNEDGSEYVNSFTYAYTIKNSDGDVLTYAPGTGTGGNPFNNLGEGRYTLLAENETTECTSASVQVNIDDVSTDPIIALTLEEIQYRKAPPANPSGQVLAEMSEAAGPAGIYDIIWLHDGVEVRNETGVPAMDRLTEGEGGWYYVIVTNQTTLCDNNAEIEIPEAISTPVLELSSVASTTCNGDGEIIIERITIAGDVQTDIDLYEFRLYRDFTVPSNLVSIVTGMNPARFDNLEVGIYYGVAIHSVDGLTTEPTLIEVADNTTSPVFSLVDVQHQTSWNPDPSNHNGRIEIIIESAIPWKGNYLIRWYSGENEFGTLLPSDSLVVTGLTVGRYTVAVEEIATGCITLKSYTIEDQRVSVIVRADSNPNTMCIGANGIMSSTDVNPHTPTSVRYFYYWYRKGSDTFPNNPLYQGQTVENVQEGFYVVYLVDQNDPFRSGSAEVEVGVSHQYPEIVISQLTPQMNCDVTRPTGSLFASLVNQNHSNYNTAWYDKQDMINSIRVNSWEVDQLAAIPYVIRATHSVTGCYAEKEFLVTEQLDVVPIPNNIILSHRTRCDYSNGEIGTSIGGTTYDYTFNWYFGPKVTNNRDAEGIWKDGLEIGAYTITATRGSSGCTSKPATSDILDKRLYPELKFTVKNANCMEPNGHARVTVTNNASVDEIIWTDGYRLFYGPTLERQPYGTYEVTVVTKEACSTTQDVEILSEIMIYNGVSANGDGINDIFMVGCIEQFMNNNVKIFNRGGELVYEANYYDNEINYFEGRGNRGIYIGKPELPAGTYFYIIDLRDGTRPRSGYLELAR